MKALPPSRLGQITAVLIALATLLGAASQVESIWKFLVPAGSLLTWPFLLACTFVPATLVFLLYNYFLYKEQEKVDSLQSVQGVMEARLKVYEQELMSDVVTGVPNNRKLDSDIKGIQERNQLAISRKGSATPPELYQLVQIDLNDFKELNQKATELRADRILRLIAQSIYRTMRRDEEMYQLSPDETRRPDSQIYRKYPGGDEFMFLLRGAHHVAVGFAARLKDRFEELKKAVQQIAGYPYNLGFSSAVVQFPADANYEDVKMNLGKCMKRASQSKKSYSICWISAQSQERSGDKKVRDTYKNAFDKLEVMTPEGDGTEG